MSFLPSQPPSQSELPHFLASNPTLIAHLTLGCFHSDLLIIFITLLKGAHSELAASNLIDNGLLEHLNTLIHLHIKGKRWYKALAIQKSRAAPFKLLLKLVDCLCCYKKSRDAILTNKFTDDTSIVNGIISIFENASVSSCIWFIAASCISSLITSSTASSSGTSNDIDGISILVNNNNLISILLTYIIQTHDEVHGDITTDRFMTIVFDLLADIIRLKPNILSIINNKITTNSLPLFRISLLRAPLTSNLLVRNLAIHAKKQKKQKKMSTKIEENNNNLNDVKCEIKSEISGDNVTECNNSDGNDLAKYIYKHAPAFAGMMLTELTPIKLNQDENSNISYFMYLL